MNILDWIANWREARTEQRMIADIYGSLILGRPPSDTWRGVRPVTDMPFGLSDNWDLLARACQCAAGDPWGAEQGLKRLQNAYARDGHHLGELASCNYGGHSLLALAFCASEIRASNSAAFALLRRDLSLFVALSTDVEFRAPDKRGRIGRGRWEYRGLGWRPAGLRSTANHWESPLFSVLACELLGWSYGISEQFRNQNREWLEMARELRRRLDLALDMGAFHGMRWTELNGMVCPPGMTWTMARHVPTGQTWSYMTGRRRGSLTGPTWAVWQEHPHDPDQLYRVYLHRLRNGEPDPRVRTGQLRKAGGTSAGHLNRQPPDQPPSYYAANSRGTEGITWRDRQNATPPWWWEDRDRIIEVRLRGRDLGAGGVSWYRP